MPSRSEPGVSTARQEVRWWLRALVGSDPPAPHGYRSGTGPASDSHPSTDTWGIAACIVAVIGLLQVFVVRVPGVAAVAIALGASGLRVRRMAETQSGRGWSGRISPSSKSRWALSESWSACRSGERPADGRPSRSERIARPMVEFHRCFTDQSSDLVRALHRSEMAEVIEFDVPRPGDLICKTSGAS